MIPKTKRLWAKQLLNFLERLDERMALKETRGVRRWHTHFCMLLAYYMVKKMVVHIGSCVSTRRYEALAEILPSSKALPYS